MGPELELILNHEGSAIPVSLKNSITSATEARAMVKSGDVEDSPADIHSQLVNNRRAIERLEYLTSTLALLKSRAVNLVAVCKADYNDAYMKAANKPSVGFGDSYATAKEKDAQFNAQATEELFDLRKAETNLCDVEAAWDYCRTLHRGAQDTQRDLETRIRLISLTSSLER